jgi:hypothetical protein
MDGSGATRSRDKNISPSYKLAAHFSCHYQDRSGRGDCYSRSVPIRHVIQIIAADQIAILTHGVTRKHSPSNTLH